MRRLVILIFLGLLLGGVAVAAAYGPFLMSKYEWGRLVVTLKFEPGTTRAEVRRLLNSYGIETDEESPRGSLIPKLEWGLPESFSEVFLPPGPICSHPDRNLIYQRLTESPLVIEFDSADIPVNEEDDPRFAKTRTHWSCRWPLAEDVGWSITFAEGVDEKTIRDFLSQFPDIGIEKMWFESSTDFMISVPVGLEWFWKIKIEMMDKMRIKRDKDPRVERVDFVKVSPLLYMPAIVGGKTL
jgi:hypothetical protein